MIIEKTNFSDLILDLEKNKVLRVFKDILHFKYGNRKSIVDELIVTINIGQKEIYFLIDFLKIYKIITIEKEMLTVINHHDPKELLVSLSKYYFNLIINNDTLNTNLFINSDVTLIDDFYKIKISSIRLKYRKILITLGKLNLLEYEEEYVKVINYTVANLFIERTLKKLKKSQKEFDKELYEKKVRGNLAEEFVLNIENDKLKDYVLRPIRQSVDDVGLGYDILSYTIEGVEMFIEVKSISGDKFFWTKNEIKTSKMFAKNYFIYCVLFDNENNPLRIERIIQNPYLKIFINKEYVKQSTGDFLIKI